MNTNRAPAAQDILEQTRRILTGVREEQPAAASSCCSTDHQTVCCEPSEKESCCASPASHGSGCGCQ